jgi:hypothetical protein
LRLSLTCELEVPSINRFFIFSLFAFALSQARVDGDKPNLPDPTDPVAGMGVNIHFTKAAPGELEMLARAGFHWIRMDLTWDKVEKKPGIYNFAAYDLLLASLDRLHIRAVLILDYTNPLYDDGKPSHTDEGRAAFARWAVAAVTHFRNRGVIWEIWNEPNGSWFWKPRSNAGDYAKLALTTSRAIERAAPDELVVGPALSGTKLDFVEVLAKAGVMAYWSGITIHPYIRDGPESYGLAYDQTRQLIRRYAGPDQRIDVLCGESGYATTWPGIDDATQGKYLARLFLFDVLSGVPLTIWYDWRDDGVDPANQEHHFGIVRRTYHAGAANVYDPKPAYDAALTYSRQLKGFRFKQRVKTVYGDDFVLIFTRGATECRVAWTSAAISHQAVISVPDGLYSVTSFDGKRQTQVAATGGIMTLTIDGGPQYLKRL